MSAGSKAARVWKRTWVGALIAGAMALVLWIASSFESALPVLVAAGVLLAVCVWELDRMGSFRGRRFGAVLALPALVGIAIALAMTREWSGPCDYPPEGRHMDGGRWLVGLVCVAVATTFSFGWIRASSLWTKIATTVVLGIPIAAASLEVSNDVGWFVTVVPLLYLVYVLARARDSVERRDFAIGQGLAAWLALPLPTLAVVWFEFGHWSLVALIVIAKLGDTAAYYAGHAFGKHHPFPRISPGKTLEGCIASLAAGTAAGVACVALGLLPREPLGLAGGALGGAIANVAAQIGDLLESWVKRKAGVKDSGTWFGPSGGMLDLVDSFLVATPVALALWPSVFEFPAVVAFGSSP